MSDEVMATPMEFSLKYCFDIADISHLQPGDKVSSSCPPTDTMHKDRSVVYSPAGFPLHFSLHLIYEERVPVSPKSPTHGFLLHLTVDSDVACLPPFRIQPVSIPSDQIRRPMHMDGRLLGPLQAEVWRFRWHHLEPWTPAAFSAVGDVELGSGWEVPGPGYPWTGEFRFQLLDEPLHLIKAEWSRLPQDMISAILRELPPVDRVSARLVCHSWSHILDTDSRCWSNVTHVQSMRRQAQTPREGRLNQVLCLKLFKALGFLTARYREGRLNHVMVRDLNLYKALGFLTSSQATIRSLELDQFREDMYKDLINLPTELSQRKIKLKALLFHATDASEAWAQQDEAAESALLKLIESQPTLERLHLEFVSIPIPSLLLALPQLRILSLLIASKEQWEAFQAQPPQLSGLHGLRVAFAYYSPDSAQMAHISSIVEGGSRLRRVEGIIHRKWPWSGGPHSICGKVVVWGTESLSPAAAAILLMSDPSDACCAIIKDHCI